MKTFFLFLLLCTLVGCDGCKDDPKPKTELEKLPSPTKEGKNTFGCLVNGKAWVTRTSIDAVSFYQSGLLYIGADLSSPDQSLSLAINDQGSVIMAQEEFDLVSGSEGSATFSSRTNTIFCDYGPMSTIQGKVTITSLSTTKLIVSGLFEFTTITDECDTIKVTNGRFDLTYAN